MKLVRDFYIPTEYTLFFGDIQKTAVIFFEKDSKYMVKTWTDKAIKPTSFYYFKTEEDRLKYATQWVDTINKKNIEKQAKRDKKKLFKHTLEIGDILSSSWGHEQTNTDFYAVVAKTEKTVTIRQLQQTSTYTGHDYGHTLPVKDAFYGNHTITKKVQEGNWIRLTSYSSASPCEEIINGVKTIKPKYFSQYA